MKSPKFAICNELYVDWEHERAFAHAADLGYSGIEIAPFTLGESPLSLSTAKLEEIHKAAEKNGLEVVGLHWLLAKTTGLHLTHPDRAVRKSTIEYLCGLARLCRDIGGKIMVFGSPPQRNLMDGVSKQAGVTFATEVFQEIASTLESCEITLALEPLGPQEGNFMLTAQSAIEICLLVDSPNVKLHLDVKAMSSESKPIPQIIRESRDWLVHFHANDPNRRGPGMGDVDFAPILEVLDEVRYNGWISVEVFDYEPGIDSLAGESIRYMRELVSNN